jgi:cyclic pyranopterin phosphate synthase
MTDSFGRKIDYLRLSLTERCRQRCTYCSKSFGGDCIKDKEMSAADFIFVAGVCAEIGFNKIRLTGGEPLLRRDLAEIISGISALGAYEDIALTTNADLLAGQAESLRAAGLMRCNISLDSLNPETYRQITGGDLQPVLEGIKAAARCFPSRLRLNTVLLKGVNDGEIDDFIALSERYPVDVRFIELMPMGDGGEGISNMQVLAGRPQLIPCPVENPSEPAVYYKGKGFKGRVGFISPMSRGFCSSCNRIRITSDGTLRPCLGDNSEYSLRAAIEERDVKRLAAEIAGAIRKKPRENCFGSGFEPSRKMNRIGG